MVDGILGSLIAWWAFVWLITIGHYFNIPYYRRNDVSFKYGLVDLLGILALVGIVVRHW